ncbi:MAG: EAL domain-containing protein [Cyanothece sp. SIO2G6]|nr:EAL domain-containing protein [Cyanothece sp. SIO2G6]
MQKDFQPLGCHECADNRLLDFDFTMAFQPIVNTTSKQIFAYEALVRGINNEPAVQVFEQVNDSNRYRFDQACRVKAVKLASELGITCLLSINFMPNAVYRPELCIRTTLAAAEQYNFPIERILFEITEAEFIEDQLHLAEVVDYYKQRGFLTAIDDFGAGYSGLNFLANVRTDLVKLDMALVRNINRDKVRQAIIKGVRQVCEELDITLIAEGVETAEELRTLQSFGIELFQGYYFARPLFQALPTVPLARFL